ncbi:MAG: GspH/FimT family pseudopilin [Candidatus Binatia bacterium]
MTLVHARQCGKRSGGFSALELVVAIAISTFVLTMATLAQSGLLPHYRLSAATRQVVTDLRLLRGKAIAQNNRFKLVFAASSSTYHAQRFNATANAWEHYALYARQGATVGTVQPVSLPGSIVAGSALEITFEPRGTVTTSGGPSLTLTGPGPRSRVLTISFAGLITIS